MKLKTTKKEIRGGFYRILSIGYCDAQYLLKYKNPFGYSAGVYGKMMAEFNKRKAINGVMTEQEKVKLEGRY